jgi:hypothetical protein
VEKVLVCLLASTRAHQLTFPSFKRHVLDELNADLALALAIDENYDYANRYWQHAKYRWTAPNFSDVGELFDLAQRWLCHQHNMPAQDWRPMLQIRGIWQGGIRSPYPQQTMSSIQTFCRWLLLSGLQQDEILDRYDRFVISRSDFVWLCPHPPLSILDRNAIWVPDGEDYSGLNDRHLVVSRADVVNCLNVIDDILLRPIQLYEEMRNEPGHYYWNNELFFAHHLRRKGLFDKVKRFAYVMYMARQASDENPTWSRGRYEPAVRHYVKYDKEFRAARSYAMIIRSRADWEKGEWRLFDPALAVSAPVSLLRHVRYVCETGYVKIQSALRRPGRVRRFARFIERMLGVRDLSDDLS